MSVTVKNIFVPLPVVIGEEEFVTLFKNSSVKIERIVSHSHSSPQNDWYDQDEDEWLIVLRGAASLEFASGERVEMSAGDYLTIPRHARHRVSRTSAETIWLAVQVK